MTNEERLDEIERTQREIWKSLARLTAIIEEMDRRLADGSPQLVTGE